jgi:hypothetical protein
VRVSAGAVDHGAGDPTLVGDPREDIAPHSRVLPAAVVQHHDAPRPHIIDVIANRAGRTACRAVEDRECAAGKPEARIERLDVQALPGDAESIERIADRGRVEPGCANQVEVVGVVCHHRFNIVS